MPNGRKFLNYTVLNVTKLERESESSFELGGIIELTWTKIKFRKSVVSGSSVFFILFFDENLFLLNSSLSLYNVGIYINRLKILFCDLTA